MTSSPRRLFLLRPPWRTIVPAAAIVGTMLGAYLLWQPGLVVTDGRHDHGRNGLWIAHGWLGGDSWFASARRAGTESKYRDAAALEGLAARLRANHITDVFPHLCPFGADGSPPEVDDAQAESLLDHLAGVRVMPWIGGVSGETVRLEDPEWRASAVGSVARLLADHPRLAGVHVNVEPCPSGNRDFLIFLDELRAALPRGKVLSVAAYPPPTVWQPNAEVHWDEAYYVEVSRRVNQMVVMMYDTGLHWSRVYRNLMAVWTGEVLAWSGAEVLLGLPAYDDAGVPWHDPLVENLDNALRGVHAGLAECAPIPPPNYQGVALYADWEMDEAEWRLFGDAFLKRGASGDTREVGRGNSVGGDSR